MLKTIGVSLFRTEKRSKLNIVFNVLIVFFALLLLIRIIFYSMFSGIYVIGNSMNHTLTGAETKDLPGGDYLYVNRNVEPNRGDIVVVSAGNKAIIKRVIALEGDSVYLDHGKLYIKYSGTEEFIHVQEDYVAEENNSPNKSINTTNIYNVEADEMFLLGDNRNISNDSRNPDYGCFSMDSLYGVVADWSLKNKRTITNIYTFFTFDFLNGFFAFVI